MTYVSHANYLVVPRAMSESWEYLPVSFTNKIDAGSYWSILPETHLYQFGILNSAMHMAWIKCVAGKMQCYDRIDYNPTMKNYPWPISHTQAHIAAIESKALTLLLVRAQYPATLLVELYNPASMPIALRNAHMELDKAVDAAYGQKSFASEESRVGFLLNYQRKLTSLLISLNDGPDLTPETMDYAAIPSRPNAMRSMAGAVF